MQSEFGMEMQSNEVSGRNTDLLEVIANAKASTTAQEIIKDSNLCRLEGWQQPGRTHDLTP